MFKIGKYEFGNVSYNHIFDPQAIIHRFDIRDSEIHYNSRYVQSRNYKGNTEANTVVFTEMGTWGEDYFVSHNEDGSLIEDEDTLKMVWTNTKC